MSAEGFVWTPPLLLGVGLLGVIELGLMVWAVLDWVKRPQEQVRGNRILWLLLILLVNIVGPIIYLTVGRLPKVVSDAGLVASPEAAQAAADSLYGSSRDSIIS